MNTKEYTFVTCRKSRSRYTEDFEDIQLEDTNSDMDPTCIHSDKGKGIREDEDRMEFRNLVSALQDLAKGKKDVLNAINKLSAKPEPSNSSTSPSPVDRGSTSSSGKVAYTNIQNTLHIYTRPSNRPTMPHFLADAVGGPVMQVEPSEPFETYLQEYRDLGYEFHSAMTLSDFCNMIRKNMPRGFNRALNHNFELQRTLGRLTIPQL